MLQFLIEPIAAAWPDPVLGLRWVAAAIEILLEGKLQVHDGMSREVSND